MHSNEIMHSKCDDDCIRQSVLSQSIECLKYAYEVMGIKTKIPINSLAIKTKINFECFEYCKKNNLFYNNFY
jgi:hypothetical protein